MKKNYTIQAMSKLLKKISAIPSAPGVYLFKNLKGEILYIGKAKNLAKRTKSYFTKSVKDPKTLRMLSLATDIDYIAVSTETESLMLENNLIKQHRPPYNVLMRDDKNYQFFKIDYESEIPQIYTVREVDFKKSKNKYFGPYTSGLSVKRTKHLLNQIFHLCQNKKISKQPCFAYHLKRCPGVCIGETGIAEYKKTFKQIEDFLKNRQSEVIKNLHLEMKRASNQKKFEKAGLYRDRLRSLQNIWEKQKVVSTKNDNSDFIGLYKTPSSAFVSMLVVRKGKLLGQNQFELTHADADESEILLELINKYYPVTSDLPKEIFLPFDISITKLKNTKITTPLRGKKKQLVALAQKNASLNYRKSLATFQSTSITSQALEELKQVLNLKKLPNRIEGYDISNTQGTNPVGSMVVFTGGKSNTSSYRRFTIKTKSTPDDVGMMTEMIERRFKHTKKDPVLRSSKSEVGWPLPDLVLIDGGKGQLNAVLKTLKKLKVTIPTISLAKQEEEIFLPNKSKPLKLSKNSEALKLLQRVRDEAHRFAITFHKSHRKKAQTKSILDEISGVGPKTKKILIKKFGSIKAIKSVSTEDLAKEVGLKKAKKIKENI